MGCEFGNSNHPVQLWSGNRPTSDDTFARPAQTPTDQDSNPTIADFGRDTAAQKSPNDNSKADLS